ncbi:hypothetical protein JM47_01155 [Ureaplasma diversum]|uniref:Uncharacterized protein n=1 Tax=Ureaplasma diversum TaxID=42094 RepID=A0A0C5RLC8_9BACT|nr:hypothetical protein [Ureaplasma diversum]AJQ45232.1 hypothetical protein JM47_01155 [Ureaplasma diversum]
MSGFSGVVLSVELPLSLSAPVPGLVTWGLFGVDGCVVPLVVLFEPFDESVVPPVSEPCPVGVVALPLPGFEDSLPPVCGCSTFFYL